jgi:tRNA1(Val) A37 N6-methylase TrmN6
VLEREEPLQVLDVGGNIGLFGLSALSRWRAERVVSVEPDAGNVGLLRRTILITDLADRRQVVEQQPVSWMVRSSSARASSRTLNWGPTATGPCPCV